MGDHSTLARKTAVVLGDQGFRRSGIGQRVDLNLTNTCARDRIANPALDLLAVCVTDMVFDLAAVLKQYQPRDGTDLIFLCQASLIVDIDGDDFGLNIPRGGHICQFTIDFAARRAPRRAEFHQHQSRLIQFFLKLG